MTMDGVGEGGSDQAECVGSTSGDGGRRVGMGTGGAAALTFGGHGVGLVGTTVCTLVPDDDFGDTGMPRRYPIPFPGAFTLALYSSRGGGLDRYSAQGSSSPELIQGFLSGDLPLVPLPFPVDLALTGMPFPLGSCASWPSGKDDLESSPPSGTLGGAAFVVFLPWSSNSSTRDAERCGQQHGR